MQSFDHLINNLSALNVMELRNLNRYYLHPQDKRVCSECRNIYSDIKKHFHIKKYDKGNVCWNSKCSECSNFINRARTSEYRKNYGMFIKSRLASFRCRANELNVPFNLDAEYLIQLFDNQSRKMFLY